MFDYKRVAIAVLLLTIGRYRSWRDDGTASHEKSSTEWLWNIWMGEHECTLDVSFILFDI